MAKYIEELGSYQDFRAPWETEDGTEADVDKSKAKKALWNARSAKAAALDERDEARTELTAVQEKLAAVKAEAAKSTPADVQKKLEKLESDLAASEAKVKDLETAKEISDLRTKVLEGVPANVAKYVTGVTEEELEKSLEAVKADFGIEDEPADGDNDGETVVRTTPVSKLRNPVGKPGAEDKTYDFDKVASDIVGSGPFG